MKATIAALALLVLTCCATVGSEKDCAKNGLCAPTPLGPARTPRPPSAARDSYETQRSDAYRQLGRLITKVHAVAECARAESRALAEDQQQLRAALGRGGKAPEARAPAPCPTRLSQIDRTLLGHADADAVAVPAAIDDEHTLLRSVLRKVHDEATCVRDRLDDLRHDHAELAAAMSTRRPVSSPYVGIFELTVSCQADLSPEEAQLLAALDLKGAGPAGGDPAPRVILKLHQGMQCVLEHMDALQDDNLELWAAATGRPRPRHPSSPKVAIETCSFNVTKPERDRLARR